MLIFFEDYSYPEELISKYLTDKDAKSGYAIPVKHEEDGWRIQHIGYLFVSNEKYKGPVFILPKLFLSKVDGKDTLLGRQGIFPENIYDTDKDENPLTVQGYEYFLPELSLWLFRAISLPR